MLAQRMKQYGYKFERPVRRSPEVRSICGKYTVTLLPVSIEKLKEEYDRLSASKGTRYSFSRWLMMDKQITPVETGKICKVVAENASISVVISDRYNDLLRLADTRNYESCLKPGHMGSHVPIHLLRDPYYGVMYIPDKSGKFLGRTVFKVGSVYRVFRCYGTLSFELATRVLEGLGKKVSYELDDLTSIAAPVRHYRYARRFA